MHRRSVLATVVAPFVCIVCMDSIAHAESAGFFRIDTLYEPAPREPNVRGTLVTAYDNIAAGFTGESISSTSFVADDLVLAGTGLLSEVTFTFLNLTGATASTDVTIALFSDAAGTPDGDGSGGLDNTDPNFLGEANFNVSGVPDGGPFNSPFNVASMNINVTTGQTIWAALRIENSGFAHPLFGPATIGSSTSSLFSSGGLLTARGNGNLPEGSGPGWRAIVRGSGEIIPLPTGGALGLAGLGVVALPRRRR